MQKEYNCIKDEIEDILRNLDNYEGIKNRLTVKLRNYPSQSDDLEDGVFRLVGDIAQVLYVDCGERRGILSSFKVKQSMVKMWGMESAEVFDAALLNTYFLTPPRAYQWEKLLMNPNYHGDNFMDIMSSDVLSVDEIGNCISTTKRANGAVAAFLPGVLPRISGLLDADLYLAFTSIHEVMVHAAGIIDPVNLRDVLKSTIEECTAEEDFLSDNIYFYDRKKGRISCLFES